MTFSVTLQCHRNLQKNNFFRKSISNFIIVFFLHELSITYHLRDIPYLRFRLVTGEKQSAEDHSEDYNDSKNYGNFQVLLDYRIDSGDTILEQHESAERNAAYKTKSVRNEVIECFKNYIQNKIVEEVQTTHMTLSNITSSDYIVNNLGIWNDLINNDLC